MRVKSQPKFQTEQAPTLTRRLRDLRHIASKLKRSRMTPLQVCEAIIVTVWHPGSSPILEGMSAAETARCPFASVPGANVKPFTELRNGCPVKGSLTP